MREAVARVDFCRPSVRAAYARTSHSESSRWGVTAGTTRSGAFLDPLADKFLAIGGLASLAAKGAFPWVAVVLIAVREVGVSLYRSRRQLQKEIRKFL